MRLGTRTYVVPVCSTSSTRSHWRRPFTSRMLAESCLPEHAVPSSVFGRVGKLTRWSSRRPLSVWSPYRQQALPLELGGFGAKNPGLSSKYQPPRRRAQGAVFLARGFAEGAWQVLDEALRRHPVDNPIESEEQTNYGLKVVVRCQIQTPDGRLSLPSRESSAPRIDPSKSFC